MLDEGKINTVVINPFIMSTIKVFRTMIHVEVTRISVSVKKDDYVFGDITASIGLTGSVSGMVAISFPADLARSMVSKLIGCDKNILSKSEIKDGVGEIINMVAGSAMFFFNNTNYKFDISLPRVTEKSSKNTPAISPVDGHCIQIGFQSPDLIKFVLEVTLKAESSM